MLEFFLPVFMPSASFRHREDRHFRTRVEPNPSNIGEFARFFRADIFYLGWLDGRILLMKWGKSLYSGLFGVRVGRNHGGAGVMSADWEEVTSAVWAASNERAISGRIDHQQTETAEPSQRGLAVAKDSKTGLCRRARNYFTTRILSMASLMARRYVGFLMTTSMEEQSLGGCPVHITTGVDGERRLIT